MKSELYRSPYYQRKACVVATLLSDIPASALLHIEAGYQLQGVEQGLGDGIHDWLDTGMFAFMTPTLTLSRVRRCIRMAERFSHRDDVFSLHPRVLMYLANKPLYESQLRSLLHCHGVGCILSKRVIDRILRRVKPHGEQL